MGIRQQLHSSKAALLCTLGLVLIAVLFAGRHLLQADGPRQASGYSFYSCDDGKTYFRDASSRESPFQKDGKPAYRVAVWNCNPCGEKFVIYLERVNPKAGHKVNAGSAPAGAVAMGRGQDLEVKRPGDPESAWVKAGTEQGVKLTAPKCPKGHIDCEPAVP